MTTRYPKDLAYVNRQLWKHNRDRGSDAVLAEHGIEVKRGLPAFAGVSRRRMERLNDALETAINRAMGFK